MSPFERAIGAFLEHQRVRGQADKTLTGRYYSLHQFARWCAARGIEHPKDVTLAVLERYQRHLFYHRKTDGEPLRVHTQYAWLSILRVFFRYLVRARVIGANPAAEMELPRLHRRLPKAILTVDEVERLIRHTASYGERGIRDRAILETLYATGIRRMELARLTIYDVDLEQGTLLVREGKGKKDRYIPVGARACAWIDKYLREVRASYLVDPTDVTLFLTDHGKPFEKNRLSGLVKDYLVECGIEKPGAAHLFRHTMATLMLNNGADLRFIQAMLGHARLETTQIYTHVAIAQLKAVYERTHPSAKLERKGEGGSGVCEQV